MELKHGLRAALIGDGDRLNRTFYGIETYGVLTNDDGEDLS